MFNIVCLIDIKIMFGPQIWQLWFKMEKEGVQGRWIKRRQHLSPVLITSVTFFLKYFWGVREQADL